MRVQHNQTREMTGVTEGGRPRVVDGQSAREGRSPNLDALCVGVVNVFCKEPGGKFVGFAGHMVSVATAVLLHDSGPAA